MDAKCCIACEYLKETLPNERYYLYCNYQDGKREVKESEEDSILDWCPIPMEARD